MVMLIILFVLFLLLWIDQLWVELIVGWLLCVMWDVVMLVWRVVDQRLVVWGDVVLIGNVVFWVGLVCGYFCFDFVCVVC